MVLVWVSLFTNQGITREQFVTDFRTRIDEDTENAITNTQIDRFIVSGLRDIHRRTKLLPEYAETTPDGSASYTLPAGMTALDEVIYTNSGGEYQALTKSNLEEVQQDNPSESDPRLYIRNGGNISIYGKQVTSGTLRVYGSRIPTLPVSDSSYIDLPDQYIELIFMWCEWKFWVRRREADEAALARELYLDMAKQVRAEVEAELKRGASFYGKES